MIHALNYYTYIYLYSLVDWIMFVVPFLPFTTLQMHQKHVGFHKRLLVSVKNHPQQVIIIIIIIIIIKCYIKLCFRLLQCYDEKTVVIKLLASFTHKISL